MTDYGTVQHQGKTIILDSAADFTGRLMPYLPYHEAEKGEKYYFELSAYGHDEFGDECTVYWEFSTVKGDEAELDTYDYDEATRVTWD